MGNRLSKIYTKTGDDGTTGLGDGSRIPKSALRVAAMGDVDELNCVIGLLITHDLPDDIGVHLQDVQHILFNLGGELSLPDEKLIEKGYIERLEQLIDSYNNDLPPLKEFILPGGGRSASICHLARAVCRRAERSVVKLAGSESVNRYSQTYLNRLSDLLFVVARLLARRAGGTEVYWDKHRL